jgi:hypothetical protein
MKKVIRNRTKKSEKDKTCGLISGRSIRPLFKTCGFDCVYNSCLDCIPSFAGLDCLKVGLT